MLASVASAAVQGIDAYHVTVEVDAARGLPQWVLVGLPAGAVRESRERVSAALGNSGFEVPPRRVTVNLAPADRRKEGTAFDLPVALAFLAATGQLDQSVLAGITAVGELGLDGTLRPIRGALPVSRLVSGAGRTLLLPQPNVGEASLVRSARLATAPTLGHAVAQLRAGSFRPVTVGARTTGEAGPGSKIFDLSEVVGQESARRALEIAAAGGHNLLIVGPPGSGKTMLARRLPGILPPLTEEESLEITAIHSVAGLLSEANPCVLARPFRAPHHTISDGGLIGGGGSPRPGEVSLAHAGVLFLDELLEFRRGVLEALRQPLEDGRVVIARALGSVVFPARCALVAAMNPCPCGHAGDPTRACVCTAEEITRYRARLSGPLADRLDLHVNVGPVPVQRLQLPARGEPSTAVRHRVAAARQRQRSRYARVRNTTCNANVSGAWLLERGAVSEPAIALLGAAAQRLGLSARGFHRVLRVARTIADLDACAEVGALHVAEALRYRPAVTGVSGASAAGVTAAAGAVEA